MRTLIILCSLLLVAGCQVPVKVTREISPGIPKIDSLCVEKFQGSETATTFTLLIKEELKNKGVKINDDSKYILTGIFTDKGDLYGRTIDIYLQRDNSKYANWHIANRASISIWQLVKTKEKLAAISADEVIEDVFNR